MIVLIIIICYLIIGLADIAAMLNKKERRQIKVYLLLWSMALALTIVINVKFLHIPSIASLLIDLFNMIVPQGG